MIAPRFQFGDGQERLTWPPAEIKQEDVWFETAEEASLEPVKLPVVDMNPATPDQPDVARLVAWVVVIVIAAMAFFFTGCVTTAEHKAFVEASRGFYNSVTPTFEKAVREDDGLSEQSKKNRLGEASSYQEALVAAEARLK